MPTEVHLDPDRLFPVDPATRSIARDLHGRVAGLPIISPHGHVDPLLLVRDDPFENAAELFIHRDHYVTRLMHAAGIDFTDLGSRDRGTGTPAAPPRAVWRRFCENWRLYAGTASGYWLASTFAQEFALAGDPSAQNADDWFDHIQRMLATDAFRPRSLFRRFGIEVLATTDDPLDDLSAHAMLAADPTFAGRVVPTFRPDAYIDPHSAAWADNVARLAQWSGGSEARYSDYLEGLAARRRYFIEHGAVSADHGVLQPSTVDLRGDEAAALFDRALRGDAGPGDLDAFAGHMLLQMARMSVEDGLVMTLHAGIVRNHSTQTLQRFGPDTGHDLPTATHFVEPLRPLLEKYGNAPGFHLVLFGVDETVYSREIAPLAGFYRSVYIGAPWWFLDAPDAVLRFRAAVTETAGFSRGSGFVDDTRAFLSIPARHDMSRRLDAAFLARLVREGRLREEAAGEIIVDLVDSLPREVFKL